MKTVHNKRAQ